ncbi:predicted protein (plasmid) [Bacillus thuringiensis serovar tolworthi]|uniref:Uncharacterized protein n=1 Tax=Bacillus thuringiensis subsp. tolworthi TaxID=1442 RepID=A0A9W4A852_BACTO|nr:predicted protein [Bacillus thuringiensis serovar tolworthi]
MLCLFKIKNALLKIRLKLTNLLGIICITIYLGEINIEGIQGIFQKIYLKF